VSSDDSIRLPFSQKFQIREDETIALNALFERVFYGAGFSKEALEALERIRFQPVKTSEGKNGSAGTDADATKYILLNRGETGIGKTRVFRQFRQAAAERKIPVYEIHCYDVEGIPFKPFLRVIREILRDSEFSDILREKYRQSLESLFPEIYKDAPPRERPSFHQKEEAGSEAGMIRIFDSLTQLLFEITALKPVVILVHDLHWGDRGTIELLRYIGRNLHLRNSRVAQAASQRRAAHPGTLPKPQGPESAEEDGEWREIISQGARGLELTSRPGSTAVDRAVLEQDQTGDAFEDRPVRLMILANYSGTADEQHYQEQAIRRLGAESFVFHGEIRTLSFDETVRFIQRSLEEAELPPGQSPVTCEAEAIEPIYRMSEGFPSYIHELFRLIFLSHQRPVGVNGAGDLKRIDRKLLCDVLGDDPLVDTGPEGDAESPDVEESGDLKSAPRRRRILLRRLDSLSGEERSVLAALALAQKPLPVEFLARILTENQRSLSELQELLDRLEAHFFIERVGHEFPRRGEEAGFCFRIADYAGVAAEGLCPEDARRIHQRIAEECLKLHREEGDERAYETFYHLKRGNGAGLAAGYGLLAAERFARSFSLEKGVQVCNEVLEILVPDVEPKKKVEGGGESDDEAQDLRRKVLRLKAELHQRLKEYAQAEETLGLLLKEDAEGLSDGIRVDLLLGQAEVILAAGDPNRAQKVLSKAFRLVKDENSTRSVRLHLAMARAYLEREDAKRAINFSLNGLKISQKVSQPGDSPELYRLLARAHTLRGDYAHTVDHLQRAFESLERQGKKSAAAEVLDDLGRVYLQRGNYFRAARYLYKSLEIKRREQDILGLSRSYDELGRVYLRTGDEIKTIEHLNRSLSLKERVGDLAGLNPTLGILGDLYFRLGRFNLAIRYFKREVENSQALSDTRGLVEAFLHLSWVYLELGDLKQVENLSRQITILAVEFKLRAQQAEGARLQGAWEALERNWDSAEKHVRQAYEIHSKLGDRRREAESLLDLADIKSDRELYDESLKFAAKGLIIAEELKAMDLQARAIVIKGNVHRFLKGGNQERAKELLRRGLELGQPLNDVRLLFYLFYSLAKVYHYDREFVEAGNFYAKADALLRRIADGLPEEMEARFFEDSRRKLFFEDSARFRKEVQSRTASGSAIDLRERPAAIDLKEKPVGVTDYKDLLARIQRMHGVIQQLDFYERVLAEGQELVKAERGVVLRIQNRVFSVEGATGFGDHPGDHPDYPLAQSLAEESVRRGRAILYSGTEDEEKLGKFPRITAPSRRAVLAVPILTEERVFGSLYLDRSLSLGRFSSRDLLMAETFAGQAGSAFDNRRQYEAAIREPLTGFYTPTYFLERLKDAFRWYNLHGRPFYLLGFYLPTLEDSVGGGGGLGENVAQEVASVLPGGAAGSWWNPILGVLLFDVNSAMAESVLARIAERLQGLLKEESENRLIVPEGRFTDGATLYYELRRSLLPEECDMQTLVEIRRLLARDITLKEAKKILEKHIIESTLRKTGGNITHAAKELGIHRPQLSNLLKKYALKRELYERDFDITVNPLDN